MLHPWPASRARLSLALMTLLAACSGDPSDPAGNAGTTQPFDVGKLDAGALAVTGAAATPAWHSFQSLAPAIAASTGAHVDLTAGSPVLFLATIPADLLGTTFVWDAATGQYVADPDRNDAPANGVRHLLYPVDPFTGLPASTTELGYVDVTDEAATDAAGAAIRIVVTSGGTTFLDYALSVVPGAAAALVRVDGYLSNGSERVEFRVEGGLQAGQGAAFAWQLAAPSHEFRADATVTSDGARTSVQERIEVGSAVLGFSATHADQRVQGAVAVDGVPFAAISGPADLPEFRRIDGSALTVDEAGALRHILELTGGTLDLFGDLLAPVGGVIAAAAPA